MAQHLQFSPAHYQQAVPHQPAVYQQPAAASPQPAGFQRGPSPVTFPPDNNGAAGFGTMPGYRNEGAAAPGIPIRNQGQVPVIVMQQQVPTENWKTGLFDCMDDPTNAVITALCPCVTFGQVAEIVDNGSTPCATSGLLYGVVAFFIAMPCIMSCTYRAKLRNRFGLVESPAPDWVTHFLCETCAICQEYGELKKRGLDPSIGWQGNVARMQQAAQQQQVNMMPPINQRMMA
ncbi:protein PLANT CADMIUM RESISTANCE 7 [Morus notabilis]|uniref:protein PLANT CADMIUM RESISTANCE 7 n=1 Tax=Morus notabilis TaxID=981085 RepID=UPI000CED57C4|nr:protein PLANT CADMIUM RESISTANCE 7 [Morus notabilis]